MRGGGRLHFTNNLEPWIGGHSPRALSMYQFLAEWRVKVKEGEPGWREDITFTFVSNVVSILFLFFSAWQGVDRLESARKCKINCSDFKTSLWQQLRQIVQSRYCMSMVAHSITCYSMLYCICTKEMVLSDWPNTGAGWEKTSKSPSLTQYQYFRASW